MSRWQNRFWQRLMVVLIAVGFALGSAADFLNVVPLPFRVPPVLVLLPGITSAALLIVALVLVLRELPRLPWR